MQRHDRDRNNKGINKRKCSTHTVTRKRKETNTLSAFSRSTTSACRCLGIPSVLLSGRGGGEIQLSQGQPQKTAAHEHNCRFLRHLRLPRSQRTYRTCTSHAPAASSLAAWEKKSVVFVPPRRPTTRSAGISAFPE